MTQLNSIELKLILTWQRFGFDLRNLIIGEIQVDDVCDEGYLIGAQCRNFIIRDDQSLQLRELREIGGNLGE